MSSDDFGNTENVTTIKIGHAEIKKSYSEKLPGITFDKKLNFKSILKIYVKKPTRSSTHLLEYLISWTQLKKRL